jgi:hypothetical protein
MALVCPGGYRHESACTACGGTGQITEEHLRKIEEGRAMRDARRARRISQSERAAELGMDLVVYSKLENGRL